MSVNVTRVLLSNEVTEAVIGAEQNEAFAVLEAACEIAEREQREMTLDEALIIIHGVAAKIEAMDV